jgi:EAL domain-containing protein (putative c-di-GMP-specific phosphodiesterase class I)/PAS domain-containing protein
MSTHVISVAHSQPRPEERSGSAAAGAMVLGPAFIGGLALALAVVVLLGWLSGNRALTTFIAGAVPMKANTALLLGLSGLGIILNTTGRVRGIVRVLATVVAAVALATGLEYVTQFDFQIDNLLVLDTPTSGAPYPGRMAVMSIVAFGACSAALLLMGRTWRGLHPSEFLALVAGAIGALGVLGYVYGATPLMQIGSDNRIALPASLGFVLLAGGVIASDADHGLTRLLRDPHLSGRLARRLVGISLVVLPISGVLAIDLGRLESVGPASAIAVLVVLQLVAFVVVGGWVIERTRRIERASASLVTERHQAQEAVEASEARLRTALDTMLDGTSIVSSVRDDDNRIVDFRIDYANPAMARASGSGARDQVGKTLLELFPAHRTNGLFDAYVQVVETGVAFTADDFRYVDPDAANGSLDLYLDLGAAKLGDGYVQSVRDVSDRYAARAAHDRMTTQRDLIARTLSDLKAGSSTAETGEAICRQVVCLPGIVTANINSFTAEGPAISLAFVRGDGVAVAARRIPTNRARAIRVLAEQGAWAEPWVRRPWHPYDGLFTQLGISAVGHAPIVQDGRLIGILSVTATGSDALTDLRDALPAVVEFAGFAGALLGAAILDLSEVGGTRARIAEIIRLASFHPVFQPVVDVVSGARVGYEALTRFANEQRPDTVFREARDAGLEVELELATLKAAILAAAGLPRGSWLSLNVSPALVTTEKRLAKLLRLADRPLVLEITEHVPVADYAALRAAIGQLRPAVRLAVDDAGSGTANLSHIVELRPAFVKLDIGLVRGIDTDLTRKAMVFGLQHFAAESHSQTIAEGVETEAELAALRAIGVAYAQGYLLGHPTRVADWSAPGVERSRIS